MNRVEISDGATVPLDHVVCPGGHSQDTSCIRVQQECPCCGQIVTFFLFPGGDIEADHGRT